MSNKRIIKRNGKEYTYYSETFYYQGRQYEVTGRTPKDAIVKAERKLQALKRGEIGISGKMTVKRWAEEWLETYKRGNVTDKFLQGMESKVERFIVPEIGRLKLSEVKDVHLQKIINERAGYSISHVEKLMRLIRGMFRQAKLSRLILVDPSENLSMPKTTKGKIRSLTPTEREQFLDSHYPLHQNTAWLCE